MVVSTTVPLVVRTSTVTPEKPLCKVSNKQHSLHCRKPGLPGAPEQKRYKSDRKEHSHYVTSEDMETCFVKMMAKMTDNMDKKITEMSNAISCKRKSNEDDDTSESDEKIQAVYAARYDPDENPFASSDDNSSCGVNMAAATESTLATSTSLGRGVPAAGGS